MTIGFPKPFKAPKKIKLPSYLTGRGKYNNTPSMYKGVMYHSKMEMEYAMILDDMLRKGEINSWSGQFKLRLDVNGKHICNYLADFLILSKNGQEEVHETKGYFTAVGKIKWKLAQAIYGDKYRFVLIQ